MQTREMVDQGLAAAPSPSAQRPELPQVDKPEPMQPLALVFKGGQLARVTPMVDLAWVLAEWHLGSLCRVLPAEHDLSTWRSRVDKGLAMLALFVDDDNGVVGAGLVECSHLDDGRKATTAIVLTFHQVDLGDLAAITETVACVVGTEWAWLWTPKQQELLPGYDRERCFIGAAQSTRVAPLN